VKAVFDPLSPREAKELSARFTGGKPAKTKEEAVKDAHRLIEGLMAARDRTDFTDKRSGESLLKPAQPASKIADEVTRELREREAEAAAKRPPPDPDHPSQMWPGMWSK